LSEGFTFALYTSPTSATCIQFCWFIIEACEVSIEYDYSNNASWVELDKAITELTEKKKALEERLRRIPAGKIIVEGETGEVFQFLCFITFWLSSQIGILKLFF
jgi:hypothetical protein